MHHVFAREHDVQAFCGWFDVQAEQGARFVAPYLLRYELGNVLARLAREDPTFSVEAREQLLEQAMATVQFADGKPISQFAPSLSYHDASYVALAVAMHATLVSYDKVMLAAAKKAGVPTLSPA